MPGFLVELTLDKVLQLQHIFPCTSMYVCTYENKHADAQLLDHSLTTHMYRVRVMSGLSFFLFAVFGGAWGS